MPGSPSPVLHDGEKQQILVPLFSREENTDPPTSSRGSRQLQGMMKAGRSGISKMESWPDCLSAKVTSQRRQNRMDVP